jgi:hypothetical protein
MVKIESYENFPLWMPFIAVLLSLIGYILGAYILSGFGLFIVALYIIYCIFIELLVIFRSCKYCYYYGKICGLGKGKIAPLFTKKGTPSKFIDKKISWYDLIPDFLVGIIPLIGGIILLYNDFSYVILGLIILLLVIFFGGTGFIRGSFACRYCKQKELGCPAQEIFNKEKTK